MSALPIGWGVFRSLKGRGLRGVRYVVSDNHEGSVKVLERSWGGVV